jgi:hypothetical protein
MRTATEFDAEVSHGNDTNLVGILFAEQSHGPTFSCVFDGQQLGHDRSTAGNAGVNNVLDLMHFSWSECLIMGEVEAEFILLNAGTALGGIFSDCAVESMMQDVRCGMRAANTGATISIDLGAHVQAFAEFPFEQMADVNPEIAVFLGIDDVEFEAICRECSGVADLTAGLCIEGTAVERHAEGFCMADLGEFRDKIATGDDSKNSTFGMQTVITEEASAALFFERIDGSCAHHGICKGTTAAGSFVSSAGFFVAFSVDGELVLCGESFGKFDEEAVSRLEIKGIFSGDNAGGLCFCSQFFETRHTTIDNIQKLFFLGTNHIGNGFHRLGNFRIWCPHGLDDCGNQRMQEGDVASEEVTFHGGAAEQQANDIVGFFGARNSTFVNRERAGRT